ncbi:DNA-binding protein WhiA [Ruminococcaceae bacterium OttesenSCG-928-I18]|nr:DNA-binding protein WhiA [Ruminococcaceae bacterium OttesenSCG-928-I18]
MSFSKQVKQEITRRDILRPCCAMAAAYGVACFSKYFDTKGLILHTERAFVARWAKQVYANVGVEGKVFVRGEGATSYEFAVKDPFETEKMLALFGHSGDETSLRIRRENLLCSECFSHFMAAAFLCCGTVVTPEKGYSLEFLTPRYSLSQDFEALLREHGFAPGRAVRKGANLLYFRASEKIEDLLTTMGAPGSALEIMQQKVYRDFRNRANRITNCETANIDKIVAAGRDTLQAIAVLEEKGALDSLPEALRQAAALRRQNPDLSLAELAAKSDPPLSKSGLSHRFKKLREKAETIQKQQRVSHSN